MPVLASEIGPVYDLLLATRDGTTLPCRNGRGETVNVSQVAYNFSVNRQSEQEEATELMHKQTVTQLGSPNVSDRELEQWPQVSQGDWSGGMYQRVFGADNDLTRFWAGEGLLWPLTDWAPQKLLPAGSPFFGVTGHSHAPYCISAAGPYIGLCYKDSTSNNIWVESQNNTGIGTRGDIAPQIGIGNTVLDMFGFDSFWWCLSNQGLIGWCNVGGGSAAAAFASLPNNGAGYIGTCGAGGYIGSQSYLAFPWPSAANNPANRVRLYNITNTGGTTPANNAFVDLGFDGNVSILDLAFMGDSLYIVLSPKFGTNTSVVQYNVPNQTYTVVASLPNYTNAYICPVNGVLFVAAFSNFTYSGNVNKVELFLLQGTNLQDIGPLQVQTGTQQWNAFRWVGRPSAVGSYAILPLGLFDGTNNFFTTLAYDVLRGRIFKPIQDQILPAENNTPNMGGLRIAIESAPYISYGTPTANVLGDWQLVRMTSASLFTESGASVGAYAYLCAPQNDANGGYRASRTGCTIVSGIVDGTSEAEPKLWRQILAKFTALAGDSSCSVTLDAWIDQDPSSLSAPQYTGTLTGTPQTAGLTTISLPINAIGIKLVWRLTITGGTATTGASGSATLIAAPTPVSVAAQMATGWVWNILVDLAPNVMPNGKGQETIWARQQVSGQPTMDNVAAYNFARQLWRLRGGRCTATWGNGDSWPALIQSESFTSPKPFGPSMRADQPSQLQSLGKLSVREDIA